MFAKSFVALAAVASFVVAAPVEQRGPPANWAYGYLEDYETYHTRYLALRCFEKKNTDYFQDCCRPMLSTENLADNRKAYCIPSSEDVEFVRTSKAAKLAGPTASATASASADAASESEYSQIQVSASSAAPSNARVAAAATSSEATTTAAATTKAVEYIAPPPSSTTTTSTTTTSTTPAYTPPPTTSTTPAYTPPAPAPTTQAPAPSNGETMSGGFATYFYQGGNPGACGDYHSDSDLIVAIDQARWGSSSFGGGSSTCGKWVTVTNTNNGRTVTAKIADVCPTCVNGNSLDLSQGAFRAIASDSDGMVPISWRWA